MNTEKQSSKTFLSDPTSVRLRRLAVLAVFGSLTAPCPAFAQADPSEPAEPESAQEEAPAPASAIRAPSDAIEEITITSRRREELLQRVAASVQAYTAEELESAGIDGFEDVFRLTSNAYVEERTGGDAVVSIRGVSTGDMSREPGVGLYVDGAYAFFRGVQDTPPLFDLESVEVLRGPQGGLYGRNSVGGALVINTARPQFDFGTSAKVTLGSDNLEKFEGSLNLPLLAERLSFRVAYTDKQSDNFVANSTLGRNERDPVSRAGRAKLRFTPSDAVDIILAYERSRESLSGFDRIAPTNDPDQRRTLADFLGQTRQASDRYSIDVSWEASPSLNVRYLGSFRKFDRFRSFDDDGGATLSSVQRQSFDSNQQTHELRLSGVLLDDKVDWIVAGVAYRDSPSFSGGQGTDAVSSVNVVDETYKSQSVFGQVQYQPKEWVRVSGQLGYTRERIKNTRSGQILLGGVATPLPTLAQTEIERVLTPGADVSFFFTDDILAYVSYSTSYKTGGFNSLRDTGVTRLGMGADPYYRPEKVRGFEVGTKTSWLDGRLLFNVSLFDMNQRAIQTRVMLQPDPLTGQQVRPFQNIGTVESQGVEAELVAVPLPGLQFSLGYGFTDAELKDSVTQAGDADGNEPIDIPRYSFNAGVQYTREIFAGRADAFLRLDYQSRLGGKRDIANVVDLDDQALTNMKFGLEFANGMTLSFFANNVFNRSFFELEPDACVPSGMLTPAQLSLPADQICSILSRPGIANAPRVVGIEVGAKF